MFTGIVEATGRVTAVTELEGARRLRIEAPASVLDDLTPGQSVAVDGACLTPVEVDESGFLVDVVLSTISRTLAGAYQAGARVNLERAMALGDRLDGHLVQGHVDGVGRLVELAEAGETRFLTFEIPEEVGVLTILHGSIALNGVSLTVNELPSRERIQVAIIPHTWAVTNFSDLVPGSEVNVEGDLLGKYVGSILAARA